MLNPGDFGVRGATKGEYLICATDVSTSSGIVPISSCLVLNSKAKSFSRVASSSKFERFSGSKVVAASITLAMNPKPERQCMEPGHNVASRTHLQVYPRYIMLGPSTPA